MTSRALLLTDVVDSTKLAERVGDQRMAQISVAHDRAVRDLLAAWRGLGRRAAACPASSRSRGSRGSRGAVRHATHAAHATAP